MVGTSKKAENLRRRRIFFTTLLILFICGYLFWNFFLASGQSVNIIVAEGGSLENKLPVTGYVLRNEVMLYAPYNGAITFTAKEGERVPAGAKVATVFAGEVDEATQIKLIRINEKIAEYDNKSIQKSYYSDMSYQTEYQVASRVRDIINVINTGEKMDELSVYKSEINKFLDQNKGIGSKGNETLAQLLKEKEDTEALIKVAKADISTEMAGVFSSRFDGYEAELNVNDRSKLVPSDIDRLNGMQIASDRVSAVGSPFAKIVNNYEWYFAVVVDAKWARELRVGSRLGIRFIDISSEVYPATVNVINSDEETRVVLVLACSSSVQSLAGLRRVNAEIVSETYTGIKIPKSAVRVVDGKTGVFVVKDNVLNFKETVVLCNDNEWAVIKQSDINAGSNNLLLYDEIVIGGKDLYDKKVLKP